MGAWASYSRYLTRRPPVSSRTTPEKSRRDQAILGERAGGDLDPIAVRAAAHGGKETDLIARAQRVVGLHVVGAEREQRERAVRLEDREAARHRLPGRLDRAALGNLQLDVIAPGRLAIAGEEPDGDLHGLD